MWCLQGWRHTRQQQCGELHGPDAVQGGRRVQAYLTLFALGAGYIRGDRESPCLASHVPSHSPHIIIRGDRESVMIRYGSCCTVVPLPPCIPPSSPLRLSVSLPLSQCLSVSPPLLSLCLSVSLFVCLSHDSVAGGAAQCGNPREKDVFA